MHLHIGAVALFLPSEWIRAAFWRIILEARKITSGEDASKILYCFGNVPNQKRSQLLNFYLFDPSLNTNFQTGRTCNSDWKSCNSDWKDSYPNISVWSSLPCTFRLSRLPAGGGWIRGVVTGRVSHFGAQSVMSSLGYSVASPNSSKMERGLPTNSNHDYVKPFVYRDCLQRRRDWL
jgi:hypothetical protein